MKPDEAAYWLGRIRNEVGTAGRTFAVPGGAVHTSTAHGLCFVLGTMLVDESQKKYTLAIANAQSGDKNALAQIDAGQQAALAAFSAASSAATIVANGVSVPDISNTTLLAMIRLGANYASSRANLAQVAQGVLAALVAANAPAINPNPARRKL